MTIELGPKGSRYLIHDPGGGGRVAKILRSGVPYEKDVVEDMAALEASGVAVDVGANIGNHTLWLVAVCGLEVKAFEPIKGDLLARNVDLNGFADRVAIHRFALGDTPTTAHLIGHNQLKTGAGDFEVRTLDEFDFSNVSILKIDTEGMEEQVITGGLETIERERPTIYAEAWDDDYLARITALLEPLGYSLARRFKWHQNKWVP